MLKDKRTAVATRRTIVDTISSAFLPAEEMAEAAAALGAHCIGVMIEQRKKAMLPGHAGAEAMALIAEGTNKAIEAHRNFASAHRLLAALPGEYELPTALGPDCAPNSPFTSAVLRSVA